MCGSGARLTCERCWEVCRRLLGGDVGRGGVAAQVVDVGLDAVAPPQRCAALLHMPHTILSYVTKSPQQQLCSVIPAMGVYLLDRETLPQGWGYVMRMT